MPSATYRDLRVWQAAIDLTRRIYLLTDSFPDHERFGLTSQMRRAAVSVATNIAEGWGRATRRELHPFAAVARGSLYELDCSLEIATWRQYVDPESSGDLEALLDRVGRMLSALRTSLRRRM